MPKLTRWDRVEREATGPVEIDAANVQELQDRKHMQKDGSHLDGSQVILKSPKGEAVQIVETAEAASKILGVPVSVAKAPAAKPTPATKPAAPAASETKTTSTGS